MFGLTWRARAEARWQRPRGKVPSGVKRKEVLLLCAPFKDEGAQGPHCGLGLHQDSGNFERPLCIQWWNGMVEILMTGLVRGLKKKEKSGDQKTGTEPINKRVAYQGNQTEEVAQ